MNLKDVLVYAGPRRPPSLAERGFRSFPTPKAMLVELRKHVMLRWMHQHHELELSEPGEPNVYGFVGTPEW